MYSPSAPSAPQVAGAGLTPERMDALAELPTGVYLPVTDSADAPPIGPVAPVDRAVPERRSLLNRSAGDGSGQASPASPYTSATSAYPSPAAPEPVEPSPDAGAAPAMEEASVAPVRRPIVRIPSAAQGVRTIDLDSGELSAVYPVDGGGQDDLEHPQWRALRSSDEAALSGPGQSAPAPETRAPAPEVESSSDEAFDGIENPQWRSLHSGPSPAIDSPGRPEAVPEQPFAPAQQPAAVAPVAVDKSKKGSSLARFALIALIIVVVILVVMVVVWVVLLRDSGGSAALAQAVATWTSMLS